jgi:hypothetical protein
MNSGQGTGPEDPREAPLPADEPAQEDDDWAALRKQVGYSSPEPPEPEPEPPAKTAPLEGRVTPPANGGDPVYKSKRSPQAQQAYQPPETGAGTGARRAAPHEPGNYRTPGAHQEPTGYGTPPPAPYQRGSYQPPGPQERPQSYQAPPAGQQRPYDVPKPRPYVTSGESGTPGRYGGTGNHGSPRRPGEPDGYDEPGGYNEPIDYRPDDADSGASRDEQPGRYRPLWEPEGQGGGAHASPPAPARPDSPSPQRPARSGAPSSPAPLPPSMPSDTSVYRSEAARRRQLVILGAAAAVVLVGGIVAALLLLNQHNKSHPAAAGHPSTSGHSPSVAPSSPHTPASPVPSPPLTGASGRLAVPHAIGPLRLNPALTNKFVGEQIRRRDANSFFIPKSDVVSGFYTSDPGATTFTAKEPRLMFLAAYLSGAGNAKTALHDFMTNTTFTDQHQVSAGRKGGVAACGLLPQQPTPVAHCMWADANSYADFYGWNSSPSALAKTMIAIRPRIQRDQH